MGNGKSKQNNPNSSTESEDENYGHELPGTLEAKYEVMEKIGTGAFSIVKKAKNKQTGELVAIKFIGKKFVSPDEMQNLDREIDIMKKVHHENIIRLYENYETEDLIALILEFINGGELFYNIVEVGNYSEDDTISIVRQIVKGIEYLHGQGIAHRDLKPENLLCNKDPKYKPFRVVIADFGLSKIYDEQNSLETRCGTPDYVAPEVISAKGQYTNAIDMWSCGVITYVLLCGFSPFVNETEVALFAQIVKVQYDFPDPEWSEISAKAKDFISKLLVKNPSDRLTATQALQHPWLADAEKSQQQKKSININQKLSAYNEHRRESKQNLITETEKEFDQRRKQRQEERDKRRKEREQQEKEFDERQKQRKAKMDQIKII